MLSDQEHRIWDDVQRLWADEAEEPRARAAGPRRPSPRSLDDAPFPLFGGLWAAILLVLLGATGAGLAVAGAAALGLALWRYWPLIWPGPTWQEDTGNGEVAGWGRPSRGVPRGS